VPKKITKEKNYVKNNKKNYKKNYNPKDVIQVNAMNTEYKKNLNTTKPNPATIADKSTHAEEMAIDKIQKNKTKKKINVSLLVIRITTASTLDSYVLSNSRPCVACIHKIKNMGYHGYKISKIYFSNEHGNIVCYKLRDIVKEKQHISKFYRGTNIPKKYTNEFEIIKKQKKF